jgi:uncharacterized integral membrane protein (TIGR00698 family)
MGSCEKCATYLIMTRAPADDASLAGSVNATPRPAHEDPRCDIVATTMNSASETAPPVLPEGARDRLARVLVPLLAVLCLLPFVSSGIGLLMGMGVALIVGNPHVKRTSALTSQLLSYSVMCLGAGMDLTVVGKVGAAGVGYTMAGIVFALGTGALLGKLLGTNRNTSALISAGTAICGGSAIAAVAPVIRANSQETSVALGTVFLLNAVALFLFPWVGHLLQLSQMQFGLWSALAIHDTSSVVGASLQYGPQALEIGTTVKLARALWIVPVALYFGFLYRDSEEHATHKAKRPWFILGFIIAAALVTWFPLLRPAGKQVSEIAKRCLVLTLFLIGSNLTRKTVADVGLRPFLQGVVLWLLVGSLTLGAVVLGWIHI